MLKKYWKIILAILFALAAALGLWQNASDPYLGTAEFRPEAADRSLAEYGRKAQELAAAQAPARTSATFLAVGDIMLSRNVAAKIQKANDPGLPYAAISATLKRSDFNFANLESPLGEIVGGHSLVFGAPQANLERLAAQNFQVLNLANNHALDQGKNGLLKTRNYLQSLGIATVGVGDSLTEAWRPSLIRAQGITIGFLGASYASANDNGKSENQFVARIEHLSQLRQSLAELRSQANFLVVSMHAGNEYTRQPNQAQRDFARAAIDAGADLVIGHHPHWIQTIERYRGKFIFYSLGNFIFDQMWSQDTKEGLAVSVTVSLEGGAATTALGTSELQGGRQAARLEKIELLPVTIEDFASPRPASPQETELILEKIGEPSALIFP